MDTVEAEVEAEVENTFINKLLGEMKNKFNKTDKEVNTASRTVSDDESLSSSRECSSNSSNDNIQDEDLKKGSNEDIKLENSNTSVAEYKAFEDTTKEGDTTFRKPNTLKDKSKVSDTNGDTVRKTLRAKVHILDDNIVIKRSARRRSRDCSESILQSAIARKEKSYNEGSRPQRLTRLLKPTPKILENLANAAALKLERHKRDKYRGMVDDSADYGSDSESESEGDDRKTKRGRYSQHVKSTKRDKGNVSKDLGSDQCNHEMEDSEKSSKLDDKLQRRSSRLSSRELPEASIPEEDDCFPADPESSSIEAQLIASQLCLCTRPTQLYASVVDHDIKFCTAMDSIGDKIVGCSNTVDLNETFLLRPSSRVPYLIMCEVHLNRMLRHNCCPKCGLFCTEGQFVQCEAKHQYHRVCQISIGQSECCPHCGLDTPTSDTAITMHSKRNPVFLPLQRPNYPPAKMSFLKQGTQNALNLSIIPADVLNVTITKADNCVKYSIQQLHETLKDGNIEKLVEILGSFEGSLNSQLDELEGGTLLHYAAQNGMLSAIHLLAISGVELDVMDNEQNTALVTAISGFENNVVNYLIKAGSSLTLKGTDGMTPLHIAAKLGNVSACELLLDASVDIKGYINATDDGGWTPLVWACEHGHFEVSKFLVNRGADILLRDIEQNTALHWAAFSGSEEIAELLLNNKCDVNAVNVHGDSAMHIGARQDMFNFVLIILTRGAHVDLVNKTGESVLDCCLPLSECYAAVSLNVNLAGIMSSRSRSNQRIILSNDISRGRETNPIQCINSLDDEQLSNDFAYIVQNCVTTDDIQIDQKISLMHHCNCEGKCLTFDCICCNNSLQSWYTNDGKLVANFNYCDPPMIFECNQICSCNAITCNNRVVQHGVTQRFQVFKSDLKGWSVKTLRSISKGSFVCEYIGEIISDVEAEKRDDDSYMFDLDNTEQNSFCIDAKHYGNFARFINHGCDPNLVPVRLFIEHHDLRFPRIALFANRNLNADDELSFDYGEKFWLIKYKSFTCHCGYSNCKYSEESIAKTIEKYNKRLEDEMAT